MRDAESPGVRRRRRAGNSLLAVALQFVAYGAGGCKAFVGRDPPPLPVGMPTDALERDLEERLGKITRQTKTESGM
jgi:hypothetical protein